MDAVRIDRRARRLSELRPARLQDALHRLAAPPGPADSAGTATRPRRRCAAQGRRAGRQASFRADQAAADLSRRDDGRAVRHRQRVRRADAGAGAAAARARRRHPAQQGPDGLRAPEHRADRRPAGEIFRPSLPLPEARSDRIADHAGRDGECRRRHLWRQHPVPRQGRVDFAEAGIRHGREP